MINWNPAVTSEAPALAATLREMTAGAGPGADPATGMPVDATVTAPLADTLAEMQNLQAAAAAAPAGAVPGFTPAFPGAGDGAPDGTLGADPGAADGLGGGVPPVVPASQDPSFAAFDDFINSTIGPLQDALQQAAEAGVPWRGGNNNNNGNGTQQNNDGSAQNTADQPNSPLTIVAHGYQDGSKYVSVSRIQIQSDDDTGNYNDQSFNNPDNQEQSLSLDTAKGDKYYHVIVTWSNGQTKQYDVQDYPGGYTFNVNY
jgi:hypothetical protein